MAISRTWRYHPYLIFNKHSDIEEYVAELIPSNKAISFFHDFQQAWQYREACLRVINWFSISIAISSLPDFQWAWRYRGTCRGVLTWFSMSIAISRNMSWSSYLIFNEHSDIEEHVVEFSDWLFQLDEHLVTVLNVVDGLT